ncbi:MAG: hypothetical protein AAF679_14880 [Pseudomonadota bacterium]
MRFPTSEHHRGGLEAKSEHLMQYIRFQTMEHDTYSRQCGGIFGPDYDLWHARGPVVSPKLKELRKHLDWFNDHLDAPRHLTYRLGSRSERNGVCWFHQHAAIHIQRAYAMSQILVQMRVPVRLLRTRNPGAKIWQDKHQVVAMADARLTVHAKDIH